MVMIRLKELRKAKKVSQTALGKYLGVAQPTISGWEQGKFQIDDINKIKIAEYFNVTVDELLGAEKNSSPVFTNEELMLLEYFRKLNNAGQLAAISVVRAYSVMSEYAKKEKSEAVFG